MKGKILGLKSMSGTNKAGKAYDGLSVHLSYEDKSPGFCGEAVLKQYIDVSLLDDFRKKYTVPSAALGKVVIIDFGPSGYVQGFEVL